MTKWITLLCLYSILIFTNCSKPDTRVSDKEKAEIQRLDSIVTAKAKAKHLREEWAVISIGRSCQKNEIRKLMFFYY